MGLHELTLSLSSHSLKLDIFRAEPIRFPLREAGFSAVAGAALRCRLGHFQLGVASENSTGQLERNFFFFFFLLLLLLFFFLLSFGASQRKWRRKKERERKKEEKNPTKNSRHPSKRKRWKNHKNGGVRGRGGFTHTTCYSDIFQLVGDDFQHFLMGFFYFSLLDQSGSFDCVETVWRRR